MKNSKIFKSILMSSLGICFLGLGALPLSSCSKKEEIRVSPAASQNLKNADDFLNQNKTKPGVTTTKSGLQYQIISSGDANGKKPDYSSIVRVNYEGKFLDGKIFDSSYERGVAAEFPVADLIPAWTEALQLMRPGDEWIIWVHPNIGYGPIGMPQGCGDSEPCEMPPNSLLIFKMRLESIVGAGNMPQELLPSQNDAEHLNQVANQTGH